MIELTRLIKVSWFVSALRSLEATTDWDLKNVTFSFVSSDNFCAKLLGVKSLATTPLLYRLTISAISGVGPIAIASLACIKSNSLLGRVSA